MKLQPLLLSLACVLLAASCNEESAGATTAGAAAHAMPKEVGSGGLAVVNPTSSRPTYHDFGTVLYGEKLRHTFEFENREGRPLTIQDMLPSCGCTTPRVSYITADGERILGSTERGQPVITIPAGARVEIDIAVDTTLVETPNVDKLSQVRVRSDSGTNPYVTLELHLKVTRAFRAVPDKLELGATPQSAGKSARTDISVWVKGDRSLIREITRVEGSFGAEVQETMIAGEKVWILTATAPPGLPLGPVRGKVTLSTTTADGTGESAAFTVPILAQIVNDIVVNPGVLQLANVERAAGGEMRAELLALVPGAKIRVLETKLEGEAAADLELVANALAPDDQGRAQRHELVLKTRPSLRAANFHGTAVILTDDPHQPRVTVPYAGTSR